MLRCKPRKGACRNDDVDLLEQLIESGHRRLHVHDRRHPRGSCCAGRSRGGRHIGRVHHQQTSRRRRPPMIEIRGLECQSRVTPLENRALARCGHRRARPRTGSPWPRRRTAVTSTPSDLSASVTRAPNSSSPNAPTKRERQPSRATAARAVAIWPPGRMRKSWSGAFVFGGGQPRVTAMRSRLALPGADDVEPARLARRQRERKPQQHAERDYLPARDGGLIFAFSLRIVPARVSPSSPGAPTCSH